MDYVEIAARWRKQQAEPLASSGVVLIWEGEVYGWKNRLREPEAERPSAVAVDAAGCVFIAEGGSDNKGAECWAAE